MDDQQFDQLSKSLATSVSRRQAMKVLGAAAAGGVAALFGARGAKAHHHANCRDFDDNCRSNAECCSGACVNFHCACAPGTVLCEGRCVSTCSPPQVLRPDCTCGCNPAIVCPPPRTLNPNTCTCVCPMGTTACGQFNCCPPGTVCQNGQCIGGIPCGSSACNPATQYCCQTIMGGECCSFSQGCSPFSGCV